MKKREIEFEQFLAKANPKAIMSYETSINKNKTLKIQFTIKQARQQKKNAIIRRELKRITKNVNFNIILLKGLVLDEELYTSEKRRIFSDVDLLILEENLESMMLALRHCGYERKIDKIRHYKYTGDYVIDYINREQELRLQINHIVYSKIVDGETIVVELHTSFAGMRYPLINYKDVFETSIPTETIALEISKMNPTYMILYQMCHLCKHIGNFVFYNSEHLNLDMRDVHEIALLIEKYKKRIDWNVFKDKALEWGLIGSVNLCFSILKEIYIDLINEELISFTREKTIEFHDKYNYSALIDDISFLPAEKILDMDIENIVYSGRIREGALNFSFAHNSNKSEIIELNHRCFASFTTGCWDEDKIKVNTIIHFKSSIEQKNFVALMITLGSGNCISGCQSFIVEKGKRNYILKNEWSEPIRDSLISFDVNYNETKENQLTICVTIYWDALKFQPYCGLRMPFNTKIFMRNKYNNIENITLAPNKYFNFYSNESVKFVE